MVVKLYHPYYILNFPVTFASLNRDIFRRIVTFDFFIIAPSLLFFSSMRGRQQLSCPVLTPPSGPNARPQDNMHLT